MSGLRIPIPGALVMVIGLALLLLSPLAAAAAPGVCVGPVCGDGWQRSARYPWRLQLQLSDQRGQRERLTVDCRNGQLSPALGPVDRGYGSAVARRACRLA
jgi:hypothetical protein